MRTPSSSKLGLALPHLWLTGSSQVSPSDCGPGTSPHALRIPLTVDTLPSEVLPAVASSSALAVSSFRLRARLDVCIPSAFFGQRGITPAFGYGAPHLSAKRDFNPPGQRAAQHALRVLRLGLLQDGNVRIGIFPEREEIFVGGANSWQNRPGARRRVPVGDGQSAPMGFVEHNARWSRIF